MTALLSAGDLCLIRGDRLLFRDVEFALTAGEMLLVQGANGSGKTTLLRSIAGLIEPEAGWIAWRGRPTRHHRQEFHAECVWLGHKTGCKADLTLLDNLDCERALRPPAAARTDEVLTRLGLDGLEALPMRALSAGQQRRVALARLLLAGARLWLMDEPFTNLDRDGRQLVMTLLAEHLAAGGVAVVASHQDVDPSLPARRLVLQ